MSRVLGFPYSRSDADWRRVARFAWDNRARIGRGAKRAYDYAFGSKRSRSDTSASSYRTRSQMGRVIKANGEKEKLGNNQQGKRKKQGNVSNKKRGKKRLKVPRKVRAQIKEVLRNSTPTGYYHERYFFKYKPIDINQNVADLGGGFTAGEEGTVTMGGAAVNMFFDPVHVMDAASVLFNDKNPSGAKAQATAGQFDYTNFRVDVKKQWVKHTIYNNTARLFYIKLITWEIKNNQVTNSQFSTEWAAAMTRDQSAGNDGINKVNATPNYLGATPMIIPQMRHLYNMEEVEVKLEPGKHYVHTIQGPSKMYDYAKFGQGGAGSFNMFQKGNKGCCMIFSLDVTSTTLGGVGNCQRYTDIVVGDPYGLLVETEYNYVVALPEQTGFTVPAAWVAGSSQTLPRRRGGPYAFVTWNQPAQAGVVADIEDENPQNSATVGV